MKEITALNKSKILTVIINHKLDNYDDIVFCPEKLQEANETIEKYGVPEIYESELSDIEQESSFWVSGVLRRSDAEKNTFLLVIAIDNQSPTNYTITTLSETLNTLVKDYWGQKIKVHIQPKTKKGKHMQYELIEVKI